MSIKFIVTANDLACNPMLHGEGASIGDEVEILINKTPANLITQEDLDNNPRLADHGVKVGDDADLVGPRPRDRD